MVYILKKEDEYIGSERIKIDDNDIIVKDIRYEGTPGLWELITSKNIPNISQYKAKDLYNYTYIMANTNTAYVKFDPDRQYKGGRNDKMNYLIKPFVRVLEEEGDEELINKIEKHFKVNEDEEDEEDLSEYQEKYLLSNDDPQPSTSGEGLKILPSDPNALIDRFDLLFSSQNAGHTGVRNEIVSILDELKRQRVINVNDYKKLNRLIKK